jgi:hypothetical protein
VVETYAPDELVLGGWRLLSFFDAVIATRAHGKVGSGMIAAEAIIQQAMNGEVATFHLHPHDGLKLVPSFEWRSWDRAGELPGLIGRGGFTPDGQEVLVDRDRLGVSWTVSELSWVKQPNEDAERLVWSRGSAGRGQTSGCTRQQAGISHCPGGNGCRARFPLEQREHPDGVGAPVRTP